MACYKPLDAHYVPNVYTANGKKKIGFGKLGEQSELNFKLPCGQCIGCRLDRSRDWANRCMCEMKYHSKNVFITLTYNNENLPSNGSLVMSDFQLFMKRLRKKFSDERIRFFHCGEYGSVGLRPHYHAILFGFDFVDKVPFKTSFNGDVYYISDILNSLWGKGFCIIGNVTYESCAYVARYILKKVNGDKADEHYGDRVPEYITMSRRPGIANDFYYDYFSDIYPCDIMVNDKGFKHRPPKYFDKKLSLDFPEVYDIIKERRVDKASKIRDMSMLRLIQKEESKMLQVEKLVRNL